MSISINIIFYSYWIVKLIRTAYRLVSIIILTRCLRYIKLSQIRGETIGLFRLNWESSVIAFNRYTCRHTLPPTPSNSIQRLKQVHVTYKARSFEIKRWPTRSRQTVLPTLSIDFRYSRVDRMLQWTKLISRCSETTSQTSKWPFADGNPLRCFVLLQFRHVSLVQVGTASACICLRFAPFPRHSCGWFRDVRSWYSSCGRSSAYHEVRLIRHGRERSLHDR